MDNQQLLEELKELLAFERWVEWERVRREKRDSTTFNLPFAFDRNLKAAS